MADREHTLRKLIEKIAEDCNYQDATLKIEDISSGGANYSSDLYNITISSHNIDDLHLFAKVMNISLSTRIAMTDALIFDTEIFVYRNLAEKFKKLEHKCGMPEEERFVFPKFYGYNPKMLEETVILENLAAKGYKVYDRLTSVDWPYASKSVEAMAKFHALAMAYEEENPDEYKKVLIEYTNRIEQTFTFLSNRFQDYVNTALSVLKEENKERLKEFVNRECNTTNVFRKYCIISYPDGKQKQVLIHGDFRPSNIMHKVNEDGTIDLIPLDYQNIQSGSCVIDLLYFIFIGSDAQFRARFYQRLVDHYYDSLSAALLRLRLDPDKIYPRKDFDYELKEALPYGLIIAIFGLGLVTVETAEAPGTGDENFFESIGKIKTSGHYPDRINGVIDDYIKWGIL